MKRRFPDARLRMGVSANQPGIQHQNVNFERALAALEMAHRRDAQVQFYDELGLYRFLYGVGDRAVPRAFYQEGIGRLDKHDRENGTELVRLPRDYIEYNGSLQAVAERQFTHRNTVTNQLKRIKDLTGLNPSALGDILKLSLGLSVRDML